MKQIFLLRHAKSDWSNITQQDFDRPLSKRGVRDALLMSQHMLKMNLKVDKVFCSSSIRTKETFDLCADGLNFEINKASYQDDLYFGELETIFSLIKNLDRAWSSILIVGHNPAMHVSLEALTNSKIDKFPTGSLAEIASENQWKDISLGECQLKSFIRPKELRS